MSSRYSSNSFSSNFPNNFFPPYTCLHSVIVPYDCIISDGCLQYDIHIRIFLTPVTFFITKNICLEPKVFLIKVETRLEMVLCSIFFIQMINTCSLHARSMVCSLCLPISSRLYQNWLSSGAVNRFVLCRHYQS